MSELHARPRLVPQSAHHAVRLVPSTLSAQSRSMLPTQSRACTRAAHPAASSRAASVLLAHINRMACFRTPSFTQHSHTPAAPHTHPRPSTQLGQADLTSWPELAASSPPFRTSCLPSLHTSAFVSPQRPSTQLGQADLAASPAHT